MCDPPHLTGINQQELATSAESLPVQTLSDEPGVVALLIYLKSDISRFTSRAVMKYKATKQDFSLWTGKGRKK